jgi:hypothetical protein
MPRRARWHSRLTKTLRGLERYQVAITTLLTLPILVLAAISTVAARDAAEAARDQVAVQNRPFLTASDTSLGGYPYPHGGRRVPRKLPSALDLAVSNGRLYLSARLRNIGVGFASVEHWRAAPARLAVQGPYLPVTDDTLRNAQNWLIAPKEEFTLARVVPATAPSNVATAQAVERHFPVLLQFFYRDVDRREQRKLTVVARWYPQPTPHWVPDVKAQNSSWDASPGLDSKPE